MKNNTLIIMLLLALSACSGFRKVKKPVIYLYPEQKQDVQVKVKVKDGGLGTTYPAYGEGWKVSASPDGKLFNYADKRTYDYLFWEGDSKFPGKQKTYNTGYLVNKNEMSSFLEGKLKLIGLNDRERNDMIVYWLPYLQKEETYFIYFRINEACDEVASLDVQPAPNTSLRVYLEYKPANGLFQVRPQMLTGVERKGFTVVEWGGYELGEDVAIQEQEMMLKKPAIYLYPIQKQEVKVKIDYPGTMGTVYPAFQDAATHTWVCTAQPNGKLSIEGKQSQFDYLFWEGLLMPEKSNHAPTDGFVIAKAETAVFLENKLKLLGLNDREINDFVVFWLPELEKSPYNFIRFRVGDSCNELAKMHISPKPDYTIRVYLEYFPMKEMSTVQEQKLPKAHSRKGFVALEWGGYQLPTAPLSKK